MRSAVAIIFAIALVGCGQKSSERSGNEPALANASAAAPGISDEANAAADANGSGSAAQRNTSAPSGFGTIASANAPLRFLGTWAANKAACISAPWHFTRSEMRAANGDHCTIYQVSELPGGYDLAVQCPAKKPLPTDLIKLRFAQSAGAMLVESNAIAPTGLVKCSS